jgi:tryptophan 2,3-dioxygenase
VIRSRQGRPGKARRVLNEQAVNPLLRFEFDRGSNYEVDTRVTDVLAALVTDAELHHEDHRFFQVNHLQTELAWVQMHNGMARAAGSIDEDRRADALHALERAIAAGDVALHCMRAMQDSLPQLSLLALRAAFPPNTTGLDSPGMRNLRRAARALWQSLQRAAERYGTTPAALVCERGGRRRSARLDHLMLADVMRAAFRLDSRVLEWKRAHIQLVWMTVGGMPLVSPCGDEPGGAPPTASGPATASGPTSLRGNSITDLERMATRPIFPELWQLTTATFSDLATGDGLYARHDDDPTA